MQTAASDAATPILMVDDDVKLCCLIGDYLEPLGYQVTPAHSGPRGVEMALGSPFAALRQIRKSSSVPVLMLTGRGEEPDRVVGLELGADDYLPKTASTRELLARLRAVTRRAARKSAKENESIEEIVVG